MSELKAHFDAAVADTRNLSQRPDNATLLRLYALYKQAADGDLATPRPGLGDLVGRVKWDAWNALQGTPAEEAMRRYVELVGLLE